MTCRMEFLSLWTGLVAKYFQESSVKEGRAGLLSGELGAGLLVLF